MRTQLQDRHVRCAVAKNLKAAADAPDVMQAMMVLQQQKPRKIAQKPPTRLL
jgi:hypothetical protein